MARAELWRARWVLPVASEPIRDGAVAFDDGLIVACGPAQELAHHYRDFLARDLGDALISPGFVDTHCHLEWSLLEGLLPQGPFAQWLRQMLPIRGRYPDGANASAARLGALRCLENGTTTLADSGPTGAGADAIASAGLRGIVALEVVGRQTGKDAERVASAASERLRELEAGIDDRVSLGIAPHAPYSVGPELWTALSADRSLAARPMTSHLAESAAEVELLGFGTGPLADLFAEVGIEAGRWGPVGPESPVARLERRGALEALDVAAHCVELEPMDGALLADNNVAVAHCPRSNAFLECGVAPIDALTRAGVTVALGSDSPASGGLYDIRAEAMAAAATPRRTALGWSELHRMATRAGAEALGLDAIGHLVAGAEADLIAVLPNDTAAADADPARAILQPESRVVRVAVAGETLLEESGPTRLERCSVVAEADRQRVALC